MTLTKRDIILILSFLGFLIGGIYFGYSIEFIQNDKALSTTLKWCTIPSVLMAAYYGYRATFGYDLKVAAWRNAFGFTVIDSNLHYGVFEIFSGLFSILKLQFWDAKDNFK